MSTNYVRILKHEWRTIFFITGGALALSLIFSLVQPFQYSAKTRILVIPSGGGLDAYSALKSAEAIGENIAQVIYTTSFFDKVIQSNSSIQNIWSTDENKKRKQWEKMIDAEVLYGTGMIDITVYHKDKTQSSMLASTIADVLSEEGRNYFGIPGLQITMVSSPLLSKYPVKPNILLNVFMGLLLGLLAGVTFTILTYHPAMREESPPKSVKLAEAKMHFRPEEKEERKIDEEREIISMHNHYNKH